MNKYYYLANIMKALSNSLRIEIVDILIEKERECVCKISEYLNVNQSSVSKHLDILKKIGILDSEKEGLKVWYFIKNNKTKDIMLSANDFLKRDIELKQKEFSL